MPYDPHLADRMRSSGPAPHRWDITGKPMRGFVWFSAEQADGDSLREWIDLAAGYVETLPRR